MYIPSSLVFVLAIPIIVALTSGIESNYIKQSTPTPPIVFILFILKRMHASQIVSVTRIIYIYSIAHKGLYNQIVTLIK